MKRIITAAVLAVISLSCPAQVDPLKYYTIGTPDGLVLDIQGLPFQETNFKLNPREEGNSSQTWKFIHVKDNVFRIQNLFSLIMIDDDGPGVHKALQWGHEVANPNQLWRIKANGDGSHTFSIYSDDTGQHLGNDGEWAVMLALDDNTSPRQWVIKETKAGKMFGEWNDYGRLSDY